jgi:hypothetical protein
VKPLRAVVTACLAMALAGCALHYDTRSLGVPVTMAESLAQGVPGDSFTVTSRAIHVFWGLGVAKEPSLHQALAGQLGPGAGVHNLVIRSRKRLADILVTGFTLGIVSPTSVTYSGIVTRASP